MPSWTCSPIYPHDEGVVTATGEHWSGASAAADSERSMFPFSSHKPMSSAPCPCHHTGWVRRRRKR